MLDSLALKAFDSMTNPILLCEFDGTLIYKNPQAAKELKLPHLNRRILTHLNRDGKAAFENWRESMPAFIEYESEGRSATALADSVYFETRSVVLLFFSHLLDFSFMESTKLLTPERVAECISASKLTRLAKEVYLREEKQSADLSRRKHLQAIRVFKRVFSSLLNDPFLCAEPLHYTLEKAIQPISYAADTILARFGSSIVFQPLDRALIDLRLDFKPFSLLLSNLLVLLAEITSSPASVTVTEERSAVLFSIDTTLREEDAAFFVGGSEALAQLLPISSLDLYAFEALCQNQRYRLQTVQDGNRLTLKLTVPVTNEFTVRERSAEELAYIMHTIDRAAALLAE